jgi:hypothetical protein
VNASEFILLAGGIYFGSLTLLQTTAILTFLTAGSFTLIVAIAFSLTKLAEIISPWLNRKIIRAINSNQEQKYYAHKTEPLPIIPDEENLYPLELGESIHKAISYVSEHALKIGMLLTTFGATGQAFNTWSTFTGYKANFLPPLPIFSILAALMFILSVFALLIGILLLYEASKNKL